MKCGWCGWDDMERVDYCDTWKCEECGARFEVEHDADFDGESYVDCSGRGRCIIEPPQHVLHGARRRLVQSLRKARIARLTRELEQLKVQLGYLDGKRDYAPADLDELLRRHSGA